MHQAGGGSVVRGADGLHVESQQRSIASVKCSIRWTERKSLTGRGTLLGLTTFCRLWRALGRIPSGVVEQRFLPYDSW